MTPPTCSRAPNPATIPDRVYLYSVTISQKAVRAFARGVGEGRCPDSVNVIYTLQIGNNLSQPFQCVRAVSE
jgi:hypothetical protein